MGRGGSWRSHSIPFRTGDHIKVEVNWGEKTTKATFRVTAKTVAAVVRVLNARDEWASFSGEIKYTWKATGAGVVKKVTLNPWFRITMPRWTAYRDQPQDVKDNWDAMWKALFKHEELHRGIFERGVEKLVRELEELQDPQVTNVQNAVATVGREIQEQHDELDKRTDHGRSAGVELRIPQTK